MRGRIQDIQRRVARALADFEVIEIMRRGDLHGARALVRVGILIRDDRYTAADNRQLDKLANQACIARVFRVHSHAGIAKHGFRAGRGDDDIVAPLRFHGITVFILDRMHIGDAVRERVAQMPVMAGHFALVDFEV